MSITLVIPKIKAALESSDIFSAANGDLWELPMFLYR